MILSERKIYDANPFHKVPEKDDNPEEDKMSISPKKRKPLSLLLNVSEGQQTVVATPRCRCVCSLLFPKHL